MVHGLTREEWVRRFRAHIVKLADFKEDDPMVEEIVKSELESWPEEQGAPFTDDWKTVTPEEAAEEQLSNWSC